MHYKILGSRAALFGWDAVYRDAVGNAVLGKPQAGRVQGR